jgi:hypothetical protein
VTAPSQESRPQQSASEALEAHVNGNRMASTFHLVGLDFAQRQAEEIDRLRLLLSEKESINAAPQGTEGYGLCDDNLGNVPAVAAPSSGDKRQQFTCPKCGHVGADSPGRLPLCDRCDYKVRMLPSHNGRILAPRTDAIAKWQEHVTVDDYNRMVDHARELEAELSVTPSHGGERLYTEAQVREACERAIAPILEKLNSMPSATAPRSDVYALVDAVATMFSKHPGEMTNWPEWDAVSLAFHKLPEAHVEIVAAESRTKEPK